MQVQGSILRVGPRIPVERVSTIAIFSTLIMNVIFIYVCLIMKGANLRMTVIARATAQSGLFHLTDIGRESKDIVTILHVSAIL